MIRSNLKEHRGSKFSEKSGNGLKSPIFGDKWSDEENINDVPVSSSFSQIEPVYEIFHELINNEQTNEDYLKRWVTDEFLLDLLELFDSPEKMERRYLRNIFHIIYEKFFAKRKFVRKSISDLLLSVIYEKTSFNGVSDILELMMTFASGYIVPLRKQHQEFFKQV